ncbi:MAG: GNAT family N-acetyltransferase [Pirellulaceae bacterium]|nr:GNAT family N-acetyltransferase [Pirellulaceae bacterium]
MPAAIEALTSSDVPAAMQLVSAAGWNQTPSDWERVIDYQTRGCFKAQIDGRLVGTVTTTCYQQELAWIGMMLVDPSFRRQGIGRGLMERSIEFLRANQMATIKLDATPAGRPLYEQLGFVAQFDFQRWQRSAQVPLVDQDATLTEGQLTGAQVTTPQATLGYAAEALRQFRELDKAAFGLDRSEWLERMAAASQCQFRPLAFGMLRPGRIASYLGPVVGEDDEQVASIVRALVNAQSGTIFWDMVCSSSDKIQLARELAFEPVRQLTRMVLGEDHTRPNVDLQTAICDPATG